MEALQKQVDRYYPEAAEEEDEPEEEGGLKILVIVTFVESKVAYFKGALDKSVCQMCKCVY